MKPSQLLLELETCVRANIVPYMTAPPAVGKTDVARQLADKLKRSFFSFSAPLYDPTTLQGLGYLYNKKTGYPVLGHPPYKESPDIHTRFGSFDFWPEDPEAIIFLDEFPSATPMQQAMYYQMLWGHRLGETVFPLTQRFMLAGNRLIDKAFVNRMSTANNSRLVHLTFDVDLNDWLQWAVQKPLDARVIFYIKFRPEWLHRFDPTKDEQGFPAPRTWEMVSRDHIAADTVFQGKQRPSRYEKIKGIVGEAAAADHCGFIDIMDKAVSPDLVLLKPDSIEIPTDPMVIMALCSGIANRAKKENMDKVCTFASRLPDEYSGLLIHVAIKRDKKLQATNAFQRWAQAHSNIVN